MNTEMKITAIAPWFGSKRTLAPIIVQELGEHKSYWEPFCGSMSVLLAKPECRMETVNDLHGDLVNLARTVRHPKWGAWLYRQLRRSMLSESLFNESGGVIRAEKRITVPADDLPDEINPDRAFHYFVTSWFGRNGVAGTASYSSHFCRRFTNNGGHGATRLSHGTESIPAWRRRMRRVTILSGDGIEITSKIEDASGTVIYVDPPYLVKGAKYLHDFDWLAHRRLAKALRKFTKTRVVLSYYEHPDLAELYPGWTKRHTPTVKALVSAGKRGTKDDGEVAPEVLLINGPSYSTEAA